MQRPYKMISFDFLYQEANRLESYCSKGSTTQRSGKTREEGLGFSEERGTRNLHADGKGAIGLQP